MIACRPLFQLASIAAIICACLAELPPDALSGCVGCVIFTNAGETLLPFGVADHFSHACPASIPSATTASIGS